MGDSTVKTPAEETTAVAVQDTSTGVTNIEELSKESTELINKIIAEPDVHKAKDLTYLFNLNQNKKTIARLDKLGNLMDTITDQAIIRFSHRADEIPTTEILTALKTVQDTIERSQKQVNGVVETPLIQINQQNNEVNVGDLSDFDRASRDRVKNAVMGLISKLNVESSAKNLMEQKREATIIEAEPIEDEKIEDGEVENLNEEEN